MLAVTMTGGSSKNDRPGEYLKLTPGDAGFETFPAEFSEFPIYWVGEEFGGHELRTIIRNVFAPERGSRANEVTFLYGECDPQPEGGCPPPLQIIIQPYCLVTPERIKNAPDYAPADGDIRGGAQAATAGGGPRLWTGAVTIKLYASPLLLDEATDALYSPNGLGTTTPGADLPPPDRDCSAFGSTPQRALE